MVYWNHQCWLAFWEFRMTATHPCSTDLCFFSIEQHGMPAVDQRTHNHPSLSGSKISEHGIWEAASVTSIWGCTVAVRCSSFRDRIWKVPYLNDMSKKEVLVLCSYSREHIRYNEQTQGIQSPCDASHCFSLQWHLIPDTSIY